MYSAPAGGNEHGGDELRLERPLGTNKEGLALGEALYWMAEKLTWGYEDVEPDPVEALKLFRQSADLGFSDALIRIGQLQQQGKGTARDPKAALKNYLRRRRPETSSRWRSWPIFCLAAPIWKRPTLYGTASSRN